MNIGPNFAPALRRDLLRRDLELEAVVWSPVRQAPIALDPVATVLFGVVDGAATVADLAADVADVVGVSPEQAMAQVVRVIQLFDRGGLIETAWAEPQGAPSSIFVSPSSSCMETSSCTGKVSSVNLEIAGQPVRVACTSTRVARRLRGALADHVIQDQAPLGFMVRSPHRRQRRHTVVDRGGFTLGTVRSADQALAVVGSHLAALLPPEDGSVRLRTRVLLQEGRATLCLFPILFLPPLDEDQLARSGHVVLDRLVVDVDPISGGLSITVAPWSELVAGVPEGHAAAIDGPIEVTDIVVAQTPGAVAALGKAELTVMLASEAIVGSREQVFDAASRLVGSSRVHQLDVASPQSLRAALEHAAASWRS